MPHGHGRLAPQLQTDTHEKSSYRKAPCTDRFACPSPMPEAAAGLAKSVKHNLNAALVPNNLQQTSPCHTKILACKPCCHALQSQSRGCKTRIATSQHARKKSPSKRRPRMSTVPGQARQQSGNHVTGHHQMSIGLEQQSRRHEQGTMHRARHPTSLGVQMSLG